MSVAIYLAAALAEIAGCFAFWAWLRLDRSPWWLAPGIGSLCLLAYLLTLVDAWDLLGTVLCLVGAATILWGPRRS